MLIPYFWWLISRERALHMSICLNIFQSSTNFLATVPRLRVCFLWTNPPDFLHVQRSVTPGESAGLWRRLLLSISWECHSMNFWLVKNRIPRSWIIRIPKIWRVVECPKLIINQQWLWTCSSGDQRDSVGSPQFKALETKDFYGCKWGYHYPLVI